MMKFVILFTLSVYLHAFDHNHELWQKILEKNITVSGHQTLVNYKQIKSTPQKLNDYLTNLSKVSMKEYRHFNRDQKLAFLINAYNAFTVKLIVDHYPVKSIKDIGSFFSSPWKKKFFTLLGEKRHLDNIEHDMIRTDEFSEPRIHFAVVCASLGCPPLSIKAFTPTNLEALLEKQSINFLTDTKENRLSENTLYLSKIFKWYGDDFNNKHESFLGFISKYMTRESSLQSKIRNKKFKVKFLDYDWRLNSTNQ